MSKDLQGSIVVITGASSGIGRATALLFAQRGATVVLAARSQLALQNVASEIEQRGGTALAVPTDVTDEQAVQALGTAAVEAFGKIDVWVNDASVTLFGFLTDTPMADYRRVVETNFFGCVHGARVALPIFQNQGHGTLINVSSVVTRMPQPYTSAYVASKQAIRALGRSLRQELALQGQRNIHVVTIIPATIDTPLFQHAANYSGRRPKAMPPVYPADLVAEAIVRAATHPRREVYVGSIGRFMAIQMKLAPALTERLATKMVDREHLGKEPASPTTGNLYESLDTSGTVSGGWKSPAASWPKKLGVLAAVVAPAAAMLRQRLQKS
jgi:short-subunit dehydrogenase